MAADATQQVAADVRTLDQRALMAKYGHEAAEHRRILFGRGMGMCAQWRDFRQFLADLGPAPDADHIITRIVAGVTYAPGRCAWVHRDRQPVIVREPAPIPAPLVTYGIWASVEGKSVEYGALARRLGVPMDAMAVAMRNGQSPEDLVQQAAIADELVKCDPHWLPPEAHRRQAFFTAFRMWHMQVLPKYAAGATPAFLYLYSALPGMKKSRDGLLALGLWNPPTEVGKQRRNAHTLWRRYCEALPRVEGARAEFAIYRQYSLTDELDELWVRVEQAERRFRTAPKVEAGKAA